MDDSMDFVSKETKTPFITYCLNYGTGQVCTLTNGCL